MLTREQTLALYSLIKDIDTETLKAILNNALANYQKASYNRDSIPDKCSISVGHKCSIDSPEDNDYWDAWEQEHQDVLETQQPDEPHNDNSANEEIIFDNQEFEEKDESKGLMNFIANFFNINKKYKFLLERLSSTGLSSAKDPYSDLSELISIVAPAIAHQYAGIPALIIVAAVTVFCRKSINSLVFNYLY